MLNFELYQNDVTAFHRGLTMKIKNMIYPVFYYVKHVPVNAKAEKVNQEEKHSLTPASPMYRCN